MLQSAPVDAAHGIMRLMYREAQEEAKHVDLDYLVESDKKTSSMVDFGGMDISLVLLLFNTLVSIVALIVAIIAVLK